MLDLSSFQDSPNDLTSQNRKSCGQLTSNQTQGLTKCLGAQYTQSITICYSRNLLELSGGKKRKSGHMTLHRTREKLSPLHEW